MARIIELNDLKAALVNVKMDVARFKIRRDRFPDFDFWIDLLNRSPGSFANSVTMHGWIDKQQFQTAMITFNVYNGPACFLTILPDTIGRALINTVLNRLARDYLVALFKLVVALAKFCQRAISKGPLIVFNKSFTILWLQQNQFYHN